MSWHLLEKGLDEIGRQSTIFGKLWATFFFILRVIPITRMGESVYGDEQAAFKCNARQPGCENVCFNQFSPISPVRFWGFQLVVIATPPLLFLVYAAIIISQIPAGAKRKQHLARLREQKKYLAELKGQKSSGKSEKIENGTTMSAPRCDIATFDPSVAKEAVSIEKSSSTISCRLQSTDKEKVITGPLQFAVFYISCMLNTEQKSTTRWQERSNTFFEVIAIDDLPLVAEHLEARRLRKRTDSCVQATLFQQISLSQANINAGKSIGKQVTNLWYQRNPSGDVSPASSDGETRWHSANVSIQSNLTPLYRWAKVTEIHEMCRAGDRKETSNDKLSFFKQQSYDAESGRSFHQQSFTDKTSYQVTSLTNAAVSYSMDAVKKHFNMCKRTTITTDSKANKLTVDKQRPALPELIDKEKIENMSGTGMKQSLRRIANAYFIQCWLRLLLEGGFVYFQYYFFRFKVPDLYKCKRWPCPETVDCFVSRSNEKSFMLFYMFSSGTLCAVLTASELLSLIFRHCKSWHSSRRAKAKKKKAEINFRNRKSKEADAGKTQNLKKKKLSPEVLAIKKDQMGIGGGWLLNDAQSGTSSGETASFNSAELSAMLENDMACEEVDLNEDPNDDGDDFD